MKLMDAIDRYAKELVDALYQFDYIIDDIFLEKDALVQVLKNIIFEKQKTLNVIILTEEELNVALFQTRVHCIENTCIDLAEKGLIAMTVDDNGKLLFSKK